MARAGCYNGAIESSIRWLKERTEHQAVRAGRPGEWTREDLRVARERTNELRKDPRAGTRPRGEVFQQRREVTPEARRELEARLLEERARERTVRGLAPEAQLTRREGTSMNRQAMRRALVPLGILTITTRRFPLPLNCFQRHAFHEGYKREILGTKGILYGRRFWSRGYCISTVGRNEA